jgi:hypothetical protein
MIAYRRVMMNETLTGFSLHDAHGPPFDETISYTPYGALGACPKLTPPTLRIACSMLIGISQSLTWGSTPSEWCWRPDATVMPPLSGGLLQVQDVQCQRISTLETRLPYHAVKVGWRRRRERQ